MGNPGSVLNMLRKAGGDGVVTADPVIISEATAIILPGVGSFDNGKMCIRDRNSGRWILVFI